QDIKRNTMLLKVTNNIESGNLLGQPDLYFTNIRQHAEHGHGRDLVAVLNDIPVQTLHHEQTVVNYRHSTQLGPTHPVQANCTQSKQKLEISSQTDLQCSRLF
ncbi:hypothetical protein BaRGS_00002046, partial [Batillaria attramentaria]